MNKKKLEPARFEFFKLYRGLFDKGVQNLRESGFWDFGQTRMSLTKIPFLTVKSAF